MSDVAIQIDLDSHGGRYQPGDELAGQYRIETDEPKEVRSVELSVLWYTLGKGEEDLSVHYFERETREQGPADSVKRPRRFATRLPNSPLSYDGVLVKICWCVRVRVFLRRGREVVSEAPLRLGGIARGEVVAT